MSASRLELEADLENSARKAVSLEWKIGGVETPPWSADGVDASDHPM